MSCRICGRDIDIIDTENELLCSECFNKIKGTRTENLIALPQNVISIVILVRAVFYIILLIVQILWYFGKIIIPYMSAITFAVLAGPVIVNICLTYFVVKKIRKAPEIQECLKKHELKDSLLEYGPDFVQILIFAIASIFIYQIWDLVFIVFQWIWSLITTIF
ncbi:MAG: hypothetical protein GF364_02205 [Candidatus Lokiarchaeota archaeon]|nr:hypothetical protein [Candidatus Lokiarchaeota archaeon]